MSNGESGGGGLSVDPITIVIALYDFFSDPEAIADPSAYFNGAFVGLPTYVKTAETGQRLSHSHCPLVVALGLHFYNLARNGHYLSSTPDIQNYFGPAMKLTTSCLYGYEPTPANAGMQAVVFSGAPIGNFDNPYFKSNPPRPQLLNEAQFLAINPGHIFPWGFYQRLQNIWPKLYPTLGGQPPPPPPPVPPPPVPPPPVPPPPPPFIPPPIWISAPPQAQDELGQIGECLCNGINSILAIIAQLQSQPPSDCCDRLIAAIVELQRGLAAAVASAVASLPQPPPIDLTQIINGINRLVAAAETGPSNAQALVVELCACLSAIAGKIPPGTDVSGIVQAINKQTTFFDIPEPLLKQMIQDFSIPSQYSALLQGSPAEEIKAVLSKLHLLNPIKKVEEYVTTEAKELTADARAILEKAKAEAAAAIKVGGELSDKVRRFVVAALGILTDYILHENERDFSPLVETLVNNFIGILTPKPTYKIKLGDIGVKPSDALGAVTGIAVESELLAILAGYFTKDASEALQKFAELFSAAIGYEEIKDLEIGAFIRHGLAAVVDMQARSTFRQHLPQGRDVTTWAARGLITPEFTTKLLNLDGFGDEIQPAAKLAAYYGIQPRQLLRMLPFGVLQDADVQDELTFSGVRPVSQSRFRLVAPYMSSERERNQLRSALLDAYAAGLLADAEYQAQLASMEHNLDRPDLALRAAKWKKLIAITKDLETQYATLFEAGLLDDATLRGNLAGIGLQQDMLDAVAAKSEARAEAALNRSTIREAAKLARATAAVERRAAIQGIKSGTLPLAAGAAALIATGLTPTQAAAWTGLAELAKVGTQHYVFGIPLAADAAAVLRKRVTDLTAQYKKGLIKEVTFSADLKNLGLDDTWINAIVAGAIPTGKAAAGAPVIPVAAG